MKIPASDFNLEATLESGQVFGYTRGLHLQIPETSRHRSYLGLKEATISGRQGPVEVTLGKQVYAWGTADAFNPTDNINPYDYLDVLDNEKLGVWSASARLTDCFEEPTSLTTASGESAPAISRPASAIAPTGTQRMTRSAPATASAAVSQMRSARPRSAARARTATSTS